MTSVVKDNEIYDYLSDCFTDLQENYATNLEIITEYKKYQIPSEKENLEKYKKI